MGKQKNPLANLVHPGLRLQSGGQVVLLNTGPIIGPQEEATIQAMFSRNESVIKYLLNVLATEGVKNFLQKVYVGYGHKSVADLGSITVLFEGISMLGAKAIQNYLLYNGQECSTRYIDFTNQPFMNPLGTRAGADLLEAQRGFYRSMVDEMKKVLFRRYPYKKYGGGDSETVYEKAVVARTFDTTRCYLPAGAHTNVAWHGTLSGFSDHLRSLRHHPLSEVRNLAYTLEALLIQHFPDTFGKKVRLPSGDSHFVPVRYQATEAYLSGAPLLNHYWHNYVCPEFTHMGHDIDYDELAAYRDVLSTRPRMTELPKWLGVLGTIRFEFLVDFGSYRDLQRHRSVTQRMPLLTDEIGFHPWYLDELPAALRKRVEQHLDSIRTSLDDLAPGPLIRQYYLPMGYQVSCDFRGDLPAWVYIAELRGTRFVHPTARKIAIQIARTLEGEFGESGLVLHMDMEPDRFDAGRGKHDIVVQK